MPSTLTFVDVGQGNCTLVVDPAGNGILVDCPKTGHHSVIDAAHDADLIDLHVAFASHQDADHLGGLVRAARALNASEIRCNTPIQMPADPTAKVKLRAIQRELDELDDLGVIPSRAATTGNTGPVGSLRWTVLSPTHAQLGAATSTNHVSVVLRIEVEGVSALLPGDADGAAFARMHNSSTDLAADVLAVPHHGADVAAHDVVTGMDWVLRTVGAPYCIVSSGEHTQYGHPTAQTVAALSAPPVARWWCTSASGGHGPGGTVTVIADNGSLRFIQGVDQYP